MLSEASDQGVNLVIERRVEVRSIPAECCDMRAEVWARV